MQTTTRKLLRGGHVRNATVALMMPFAVAALLVWNYFHPFATATGNSKKAPSRPQSQIAYSPRVLMDTSGLGAICEATPRWHADAPLSEISALWKDAGSRILQQIDQHLASHPDLDESKQFEILSAKTTFQSYEGQPKLGYETLRQMRSLVERNPQMAAQALYTVIYWQGVTSLRRGENENCIMCRGESSCILPISPAARHLNPDGSRQAISAFQ